MNPIEIDSLQDYDYCLSQGYEPLADNRFIVKHDVRITAQQRLFGKGNSEEQNIKFYKWVWAHRPHYCEECMKPLNEYSAVHVSHILSRGAFPNMAYDIRNINILCYNCHSKWENGDRESMRINARNELTIKQLKQEYETDRI